MTVVRCSSNFSARTSMVAPAWYWETMASISVSARRRWTGFESCPSRSTSRNPRVVVQTPDQGWRGAVGGPPVVMPGASSTLFQVMRRAVRRPPRQPSPGPRPERPRLAPIACVKPGEVHRVPASARSVPRSPGRGASCRAPRPTRGCHPTRRVAGRRAETGARTGACIRLWRGRQPHLRGRREQRDARSFASGVVQ